MSLRALLACLLAIAAAGCDGSAFYQVFRPPPAPAPAPVEEELPDGFAAPPQTPPDIKVGRSGLRRLSRYEYDQSLADLLGDASRAAARLMPADLSAPYDNGYREQVATPSLIDSLESLATDAARRLVADPPRLAKLLPCAPSGPGDQTCFAAFVETFGRRAFRRPLELEERERYLTLQSFSVEAADFNLGVELVIRAMLQSPHFVYRAEHGLPVASEPGVFRLTPHELASRLSYFLWGSTPPDWLLDAADQGALASPDQVRSAAARLLADARARAQLQRFHAFWLGYYELPHAPALSQLFRTEAEALVQRVVFEQRADFLELFRAPETYVNDTLADIYDLPRPGPGTWSWVSYGASSRRGIISQGGFLSAGVKALDSSPTLRGLHVRERLFCEHIPPPANLPVNVDDGPPQSEDTPCKTDRYRAISKQASCAGCHQFMDPVGFGLENFDREGRYRAHDDGNPACTLSGQGEVVGVMTFEGPSGLVDALVASGKLQACTVKQLYRFAMGREEESPDQGLLRHLTQAFESRQRRFDELVLDLVAHETFAYRREE